MLLVHIVWGGFWAGGFSFSQRFLTALFPLFVIGIAELLARTRMLVTPLLVVCVAWIGFLALHHFYGYDFVSDEDGADRIVELYRTGEENKERVLDRRVTRSDCSALGGVPRLGRALLAETGRSALSLALSRRSSVLGASARAAAREATSRENAGSAGTSASKSVTSPTPTFGEAP